MSEWTDEQLRVIAQRVFDEKESGRAVDPRRLYWAQLHRYAGLGAPGVDIDAVHRRLQEWRR